MDKDYILLMIESLEKKESILTKLLELTDEQKTIVSAGETDWDAFNANVDRKGELIDEIVKLDEGFDSLFGRVKETLEGDKSAFASEIKRMQELIRSVTEKSTALSAEENRNKNLIENKFREEKNTIKQSKIGSKAAMDYYKRMNRINTVDPQLMDRKS